MIDVCSGNPGESHEDSTQSGNQWWLDLAHALTLTLSPFSQIYRVRFWSSSLGWLLDPRNAWTLIYIYIYVYIYLILYIISRYISSYFIIFHPFIIFSDLPRHHGVSRGFPHWDHRIRTETPWSSPGNVTFARHTADQILRALVYCRVANSRRKPTFFSWPMAGVDKRMILVHDNGIIMG